MIEIREVKTTGELKRFVRFKYDLYRDCEFWVPPLVRDELHTLRWDQNPAFASCRARYWMAWQNGRPVGRVAGILNQPFIDRWQHRHLSFGWFDFVDEPDVAAALLKTVEDWARELGMTAVHGPLGFTDLDQQGMLVEGFDEMGTMATLYNFPYYPRHVERCGYAKEFDWVEFKVEVPAEMPERYLKAGEYLNRRRGIHLLEVRTAKELLPYAQPVFDLLNLAYRDLYGVVDLTKEQVEDCVRQYFPNVVPDFVAVALDRQERLAGFIIGMPSLSDALRKAKGKLFPFGFIHVLRALKHPKTIDFYLAAVRPDLQGSGVETLMVIKVLDACRRRGIVSGQSNIHLESNTKIHAIWKLLPNRMHKRRRCYIKPLAS